MKRFFDLTVSFIALIAIFPLLILLSLLVRICLGSPIVFQQMRPGRHGEPFKMFKFRSMTSKLDEKGNLLPDQDRLTKFGRWLRSTSLDELPELWNVLKGDMSLVGPRPLLMEYISLYSSEQARRHQMRPGITGWAQVNGRNALNWKDKFDLDVWYIDNQTFCLDIKILFLTVKKVIIRDGISAKGMSTAAKFTGNDE